MSLSNINIYNMGSEGIRLSPSGSSKSANITMVNFHLTGNGLNGIYLGSCTNSSFVNGECHNNGQSGVNATSGTRNTYASIDCRANQKYGFYGATSGQYVHGCTLLSNVLGEAYFTAGTPDNIVHDNVGFVTEAWGLIASCVNGSVVTHGLSGNPTSITLTMRGNIYINATCWYFTPTVASSTSTTFTISFYYNHAGTPTIVEAGDSKTIYWIAVYKP